MTDQNNPGKNIAPEKLLEEFVDGLIKEKNSPYVTDQNREEVKKTLLDDISDAVNRKLIAELSDQQVDELNVLLEKKASDDEVNIFFKSKIANIDQVIAQALTDFRAGYLTVNYQPEKKIDEKPKEELLPLPAPVGK